MNCTSVDQGKVLKHKFKGRYLDIFKSTTIKINLLNIPSVKSAHSGQEDILTCSFMHFRVGKNNLSKDVYDEEASGNNRRSVMNV